MSSVTDPVKPCNKCGATDRLKDGRCRPCRYAANRERGERLKRNPKPCRKCGSTERLVSGRCGACARAYAANRLERLAADDAPCSKCGTIDRYSNGECRTCREKYAAARAERADPCKACGSTEKHSDGRCAPCKREFDRINKPKNPRPVITVCLSCGMAPVMKARNLCKPCARANDKAVMAALAVNKVPCAVCGGTARVPTGACNRCVRAHVARRRARLAAAVGTHTADDIARQYEAQEGRCWWCNKAVGDTYQVDHVIPISRGGSNGPENLAVTCPHCNWSKNDRLPSEWAGRLF